MNFAKFLRTPFLQNTSSATASEQITLYKIPRSLDIFMVCTAALFEKDLACKKVPLKYHHYDSGDSSIFHKVSP